MKRLSRPYLLFAALCLFVHGVAIIGSATPQRQRRRARTQPRPPVTTRIDYTKFLHTTKQHQAACGTCHKIPTANWQKAREHPDIADYPGHDACVRCHRPQFFRSPTPPICSVCHSKVSPRDDVRFAFRNPAASRQFQIEFPHDKHQDVIARLRTPRQPARPAAPAFVRAAFVRPVVQQDKTYNNCAICHVTETVKIKPASGWPDGVAPDDVTFKSAPERHAACFNCHWKSEEPVAANCAGCHKLAPAARSPAPKLPRRISWKFRHDGGGDKQAHVLECTTCHINITKSATLRGLKPDVPITSCTECHNRQGLRLDVSRELEAIDKDREFVCSYCHTSEVGRQDPPASHYLISERKPIKRRDPR